MVRQSNDWANCWAARPHSVRAARRSRHSPDRFGELPRRFRRNEQPGSFWLDEFGKAGQLRGDHRSPSGEALDRYDRTTFPRSRRNNRAQAVLQQPEFLRALRRRPDECTCAEISSRSASSSPSPDEPVPFRPRRDGRQIGRGEQGHRLQQHVNPFVGIETAEEEEIGIRANRRTPGLQAAAPAAANCPTSTPLGMGSIRRNSAEALRNIAWPCSR